MIAGAAKLGFKVGGTMVNPIIKQHIDPFVQRFRNPDQERTLIMQKAIAFAQTKQPAEKSEKIRFALTTWTTSPDWATNFTALVQHPQHIEGLANRFAQAMLEADLLEGADHPHQIGQYFLESLHQELMNDPQQGAHHQQLANALRDQSQREFMEQVQVFLEDMRSEVRGSSQKTSPQEDRQDIKETLQQLASPMIHPTSAVDGPIEQKLKHIAVLVDAHAIEFADQALAQFKQQHYDQAPVPAQAWYHRLKGSIAINREEVSEALQEFDLAFTLHGEGAAAHMAKGYGEYLKQNFELALHHLDIALQLDSNAGIALATKADTYFKMGRTEDLKAMIPLATTQQKDLFYMLMRRLTQMNEFALVNSLVDTRLQQTPEDPTIKFLKARNLFDEVAEELGQGILKQDPATGIRDERLTQALDLLNATYTSRQRNQDLRGMVEVLSTRHAVLDMLGRHQEAANDATTALEMNPNAAGVRVGKAMALFHMERHAEAIALLDSIPQDQQDLHDRNLLIQLLIHQGQHHRILQEMPKYYPLMQDDPTGMAFAQLVHAQAIRVLEGPEAALRFLEQLNSTHPFVQVGMAEAFQTLQNPLKANDHYRTAFQTSQGHVNFSIGMQWAIFLAEVNDFEQASSVITQIIPPDAAMPALQMAIDIHERAGKLHRVEETLGFYQTQGFPKTPQILRAEANLKFNAGDHAEAAALLKEALQQGPDPDLHLRFIQMLVLVGNHAEAHTQIQALLATPNLPYQMRFQAAAFLKHMRHQDEALKLAYQAWRDSPKDSQASQMYMQVGIESLKNDPEFTYVVPETSVMLANRKGESRWVTLTSDPNPGANELAVNSAAAQILLGKKVTDEVEIPKAGFKPLAFTIQAIMGKEHHLLMTLFQQAGSNPFDQSVFTHEGDDENLDQLVDVLYSLRDQKEQKVKNALEQVASKRLPISVMTDWFDQSILDLWQDWVDSPVALTSSLRNKAELEAAEKTLQADAVVFDVSALVLLQRLGLLTQAEQWWPQRHVTVQVHTAVLHEIHKLDADPGNVNHLLHPGAQDHLSGPQRLKALREILQFVERTQVVTVPSINSERNQQRLKSIPLGVETWSTVMAAEANGFSLYTEDVHLKNHVLKGNLQGPPILATSTVDALAALLLQGRFDLAAYESIAEGLLSRNIRRVKMTENLLMRVISRPYRAGDTLVSAALNEFKSPHANHEQMLGWVVEGLKALWLDAHSGPYRFDVLQVILSELDSTLNREAFTLFLVEELGVRMKLAPEHRANLIHLIQQWKARADL
ncbi:hypothetical protein GCM10008938_37150 [Deinococcus roseus]|uniref:Tetratricopeptide repeat protein n=2 Tax=Deinococcus roseus TaxID=392414 RepID=A0ABQ2D7G9_9DEIO|nr:hypothetical protein GCM10008938_37150 [Deinococcus roseus]